MTALKLSRDLLPIDELASRAARLRLVAALKESERAVENGEIVEHAEVEALLRSWEAEGGFTRSRRASGRSSSMPTSASSCSRTR